LGEQVDEQGGQGGNKKMGINGAHGRDPVDFLCRQQETETDKMRHEFSGVKAESGPRGDRFVRRPVKCQCSLLADENSVPKLHEIVTAVAACCKIEVAMRAFLGHDFVLAVRIIQVILSRRSCSVAAIDRGALGGGPERNHLYTLALARGNPRFRTDPEARVAPVPGVLGPSLPD
jgi:hypothetical protein